MSWWNLLLLAVGVGMDAMTAAVAVGLSIGEKRATDLMKISFWFALAHAVMPLVGWLTVGSVAAALETVSGWIIFVVLLFLGICRIREAFRKPEETPSGHLLLTALTTGLDAMSVGVTMALSPPTGLLAHPTGGFLGCAVTAAVTFVMCLLGTGLGTRLGARFGRPALLIGGGLLIILSLRALLSVM
ncbi:MAG: manganese efflux pump [Clostridia bacterium]|nr:manganese efflux pump [Clostridia bacterium]